VSSVTRSESEYLARKSGEAFPEESVRGQNTYGLLDAVSKYFEFYREADIEPPFFLMLTLCNVRGYRMAPHYRTLRPVRETIDRDPAILPEVVIDNVSLPRDILLKPMLDSVWNAAGFPSSPNYVAGRWKPR
jgi:hypothetical protein